MSALSDPEFIAMRRISKVLENLDFGQRRRVLEYAASRYVRSDYGHGQKMMQFDTATNGPEQLLR